MDGIDEADCMKHFRETRTEPDLTPESEPGQGSGPESSVSAGFSPVGLSTIDSDALLTASPEEEGADEEEGQVDNEGPKDHQVKVEPHQELKTSSCVFLERHRRKRITQSCRSLRQLLPIVPSTRIDMVTILKMTVVFLETVQQLAPAADPTIQLCPPVELHADWLLQSHKNREVGQKMATEQEKKKLDRSGCVSQQRKRRMGRRQTDR